MKNSSTVRSASITALLFLTALCTGVAVGYLYHQITRVFELAIVFPALAGLLAGATVAVIAGLCRCPSLRTMQRAGLLAGVLAFACSFYFDYQEFRSLLAHTATPGVTLSAAQVDQAEQQLLGSSGLLPYLNARAHYGVVRAAWQPRGSSPVQGDAEWLLWAGELALAAAAGRTMAGAGLRARAAQAASPVELLTVASMA